MKYCILKTPGRAAEPADSNLSPLFWNAQTLSLSKHCLVSLLFLIKADSVISYTTSFLWLCRIRKDWGHFRENVLSWPGRCPTHIPQPAPVHKVLHQQSQVCEVKCWRKASICHKYRTCSNSFLHWAVCWVLSCFRSLRHGTTCQLLSALSQQSLWMK